MADGSPRSGSVSLRIKCFTEPHEKRIHTFVSSNYFLTFFALVTTPVDCKTANLKLTQISTHEKRQKVFKVSFMVLFRVCLGFRLGFCLGFCLGFRLGFCLGFV